MIDGLSRGGTIVYGYPESGVGAKSFPGNLCRDVQQPSKQRFVGLRVGIKQRRKMRLGDDQDVPGRDRSDVVKRRDDIIFVHERHARLARGDIAKNAALGQG